MLKFLRLHTKRIFITVMLMIIPAFCFFGLDLVMRSAARNTLAGKINGKGIKLDKFASAQSETRTQVLSQMILLFGIQNPDQLSALRNRMSDFFSKENLNKMTWERLLLNQLAQKKNIQVNNAQIAEWISQFPLFQQNGRFDPQRYQLVLRNAFGTSSITFEKQLKNTLRIQQLQLQITQPIEPTEEEIRKSYTEKNEKVGVEFVYLLAENYKNETPFSEEELKEYYDSHLDEFQQPDQIKVRYFLLKQDEIVEGVKISQNQIETFYESNKNQFKDSESGLEKPLEEVKETIQELLKNRIAQDRFYEKVTDVTVSLIKNSPEQVAEESGLKLLETDFFSSRKSPLPPRVTEAAFELGLNEISSPITLGKEVFLVQLLDKKEAFTPEFDAVKTEVEQKLNQIAQRELALKDARKKRAMIAQWMKEEPIPFSEGVKKAKLVLQKYPPFSRQDKVALLPQEVQVRAFQLEENEISEVLATDKGALFFAVTDRQVPQYKEDPQLIASLRNRKQSEYYQAWLAKQKQQANLIDLTPFF